MSYKVRTAVICVVACVWAANFLAPIVVEGYVPPSEVHVVFLAVIGFLGLGYRKDGQPRQTEEQPNEPS
jgi:hypothetical protein